ncbi:hypothetical protein BS78_08G044400 [Paspalum vaginatum]|nr:hypothetical protein BS78_08G044400 [Paspalum vaginatum]
MDVDAAGAQAGHVVAAAAERDITIRVARPPRVTVLAAGAGAHPDADKPDRYPYIVAAGRFFLLAHFAVAPCHGACFDHDPQNTHLVLVHYIHTVDRGVTTAFAERLPGRIGLIPTLWNIGSVGLLSNDARFTMAELQVHRGSDRRATLVRFESEPTAFHPFGWSSTDVRCPLPAEEEEDGDREWVPHGAVSVNSSIICWFDLSWGMLSCDLEQPTPSLNFHHLPNGRALAEATPDIHATRCITVARDSRLRYVEIIAPEGELATVTMWSWFNGDLGGGWILSYEVSFESIWNDGSYKETGLPRIVPVLAVVSPSDHELVYFALEKHLFGVNVPRHRVVHHAACDLVTIPGPPQPASSRFLVSWSLPPAVAHALGIDPIVGFDAAAENAALEAAIIKDEEQSGGEIKDEEQPVAVIDFEEQPAAQIDYTEQQEAAVYYKESQVQDIIDSGVLSPVDLSSSDEEMLQPGMDLTVLMDQSTCDRLKAEVKEEFAKKHQGS